MKYTATVGVLALVVAACGATTETTTTATGSTSTTSSTTTSTPGSTTEGPTTSGSDITAGTQGTVPPVIAQVGFAFASGDDPTVLVRVSVAETPDGPWLPAGGSDEPRLFGSTYWVRFDITNTDGWVQC